MNFMIYTRLSLAHSVFSFKRLVTYRVIAMKWYYWQKFQVRQLKARQCWISDNFKWTTSEEPIVLYQVIAAFSSSEFPPKLALSNNPEHWLWNWKWLKASTIHLHTAKETKSSIKSSISDRAFSTLLEINWCFWFLYSIYWLKIN